MKDSQEHKPFNNKFKHQNKPLVANKGFRKFDNHEKQHFQPHRRHHNDYDDLEDDFDENEEEQEK